MGIIIDGVLIVNHFTAMITVPTLLIGTSLADNILSDIGIVVVLLDCTATYRTAQSSSFLHSFVLLTDIKIAPCQSNRVLVCYAPMLLL
jgi:hypothetical protein